MTNESSMTRPVKLRMTRRGRIVLALFVAILLSTLVALSVMGGGSAALASNEPSEAVAFETVVAMPGDSLWTLATRIAPEHDPRDVIADIKQLNQLMGSDLMVGEELAIPLRYTR